MVPINPEQEASLILTLTLSFYNTSPVRQHDRLLFPAMEDKRRCSLIQFNCPTAQGNCWNSYFSSPRHYKHSSLKVLQLPFSSVKPIFSTRLKGFDLTLRIVSHSKNARAMFLYSEREKDITATKPESPKCHKRFVHIRSFITVASSKTTGGHLFKLHSEVHKMNLCFRGRSQLLQQCQCELHTLSDLQYYNVIQWTFWMR